MKKTKNKEMGPNETKFWEKYPDFNEKLILPLNPYYNFKQKIHFKKITGYNLALSKEEFQLLLNEQFDEVQFSTNCDPYDNGYIDLDIYITKTDYEIKKKWEEQNEIIDNIKKVFFKNSIC